VKSSRWSWKLLIPLLLVLAFSGCSEFFDAEPSLDAFSSNVVSASLGETIYLTVRGSTQGPNFSAFADYEGTLRILVNGVERINEDVDGDFDWVVPLKMEVGGTVTVVGTVEAANDTVATREFNITVGSARPNEGTTSNPLRLTYGGSPVNTQVGTGSFRSSYYRFVAGASTVTVNVSGVSPGSTDLDFYLYSNSSWISPNPVSETAGTPSAWEINGLVSGATYHLRIYNWNDVNDTSFSLSVN
jgi:hypothetical protein